MGFRFPTNRTLAKIAVYGAFASITGAMYFKYKIEDRVRNQEYYRQAFQILRSHPGVVKMLGEPIKDIGLNLGDNKNNYCDGKNAKFEVKVKGPQDKGTMFFWANRIDGEWKVNRLELEVKSQPDKRFLVKKSEAGESTESSTP